MYSKKKKTSYNMERIKREDLNMGIAELISRRATCSRAQVGAVITLQNRIVSTGYNGSVLKEKNCTNLGCDLNNKCTHAMHAEANAIAFAARQGISLEGTHLYCTHEPCYECAKLIIQAGIKEVTFRTFYKTNSGVELLLLALVDVNFPKETKDNGL